MSSSCKSPGTLDSWAMNRGLHLDKQLRDVQFFTCESELRGGDQSAVVGQVFR